MLSGDNSILQKATDSKTQTGIGQEKEALSLAYNSCTINKITKGENITDLQLRNELKSNGYKNTSVVKNGNKFKVTFESGNIYTIRDDGTVSKYEKVEPTSVYAKLYTTDGILMLSSTNYTDETLGEYADYGDVSQKVDYYAESRMGPEKLYGDYPGWIDENIYMPANSKVKKIIIHDRISPTNTSYWFAGCNEVQEIEGIQYLDTSNVTNMKYMFRYCYGLKELDLSNFDTENVTNMYGMFHACEGLSSLDLSSFNTKNVSDMGFMFGGLKLDTLDLSNLNTSNVTNMSNMFYQCINLVNLNITGWDTSKVENMSFMFYSCTGLTSLNLIHFNTINVINMNNMFYSVTASVRIGSNWNPSMTESATKYSGTFEKSN